MPLANASYSAVARCPEGCVKYRQASWQVTITNDGARDLEIISMSIVDAKTQAIIANTTEASLITTSPDLIGSDQPAIITIAPHESYTAQINGTLPAPNLDNQLSYMFCTRIRRPYFTWEWLEQTFNFCYPENLTMIDLECEMDDDCTSDQYCDSNHCLTLNCTECQFFENHACYNYACCNDHDCRFDELCKNHECQRIDCNESLYLFNHTCTEKPCMEGQIMQSTTCSDEECPYDHYWYRYGCDKLNCSNEEGYFNHTCQRLNCTDWEGMDNHECVGLECKPDEHIQNHNCTKLACNLLQKGQEHECRVNSLLVIELSLFILVLLLLMIDIRKYNSHYRRKLVDYLLRKAHQKSEPGQPNMSKEGKKPEK